MIDMRRFFTVIVLFLIVLAASSTRSLSQERVKLLDMDGFKSQISDGLSVDTWKFKGSCPVVVNFYASWSTPCKQLASIFEQVAAEYKDRVEFYRVDVEKSSDLASRFDVKSVPTLLFIPFDGEPEMMEGMPSKDELRKLIDYCFFVD